MTGKANFTPEEWQLVLEGPTGAGMVVITAQRGGTFRETFSMAKAYAEARQQHGESQLLDELVSTKAKMDRTRHGSPEELKDHALGELRDAVGLLQQKATSEEVEEMHRRGFAHHSPLESKLATGESRQPDPIDSLAVQRRRLAARGCGCLPAG